MAAASVSVGQTEGPAGAAGVVHIRSPSKEVPVQDHDEQRNAHDPQTSSQPIRYVAGRGRGGPPAHYQRWLPLDAMAVRLAPDPPSNGELGASGAAVADGMVVDEPELAPDPPSNGEVGAAGPERSRLRDRVLALFANDTTYLTVVASSDDGTLEQVPGDLVPPDAPSNGEVGKDLAGPALMLGQGVVPTAQARDDIGHSGTYCQQYYLP